MTDVDLAKVRETLEWYADTANYGLRVGPMRLEQDKQIGDRIHVKFAQDHGLPLVLADKGAQATAALALLPREEDWADRCAQSAAHFTYERAGLTMTTEERHDLAQSIREEAAKDGVERTSQDYRDKLVAGAKEMAVGAERERILRDLNKVCHRGEMVARLAVDAIVKGN